VSDVYIRRLRSVQAEFNAARVALFFTIRNWQRYDIGGEPDVTDLRLKPGQFERAQERVEETYFVRMYAEFEGILKDHLTTNHPKVSVPDRPKVDQLISAVLKAEKVTIDPALRAKLDAVRDYRNSIAHSARRPGAVFVPFVDALSRLNTFVDKLPDPRT